MTSLSEPLCKAVLKRLASFGYKLKDEDSWELCFAMQTVENRIKNACNTTSIPEGLFSAAVNISCGEFLFSKKKLNRLEIEGLDFENAIKSINEGDTSVAFEGSSDEDKFEVLLNYLLHYKEDDFVCFRQMVW